jgi:hypothetical protein
MLKRRRRGSPRSNISRSHAGDNPDGTGRGYGGTGDARGGTKRREAFDEGCPRVENAAREDSFPP